MPGMNFYIDNLPGAPFDYFWELKVHEEERRYVHYDPTKLNGESVTVKMEKVPGQWELRMVNTEDAKKTERLIITSLTDDSLREAAYKMVERFILRNRTKVLEEETVRLIAADDPQ